MFDDTFLFLIIAVVVVGFIMKILWWVWAAMSFYHVYKVYNAAVEDELRRLWMLQQQHQNAQAAALQRSIMQQISSLPRQERREYRRKLSDVVHEKLVLDPRTGEWVNA